MSIVANVHGRLERRHLLMRAISGSEGEKSMQAGVKHPMARPLEDHTMSLMGVFLCIHTLPSILARDLD